jgi:hypothetical protein
LRIPRVNQQHTGEYRCSAVNSSGRVSSALWVAVVPTRDGKGFSKPANYNSTKQGNQQNQGFYFENPLSNNTPVMESKLIICKFFKRFSNIVIMYQKNVPKNPSVGLKYPFWRKWASLFANFFVLKNKAIKVKRFFVFNYF